MSAADENGSDGGAAGVRDPGLPARRRRTVVLCYHAISERWPAGLAVSRDALHRQVRSFMRQGFVPAGFTDAISAPGRGRTLSVTFDDAYRSVYEHAYPVLASLGATATLFVPTAHAGDGSVMSWPGIDGWVGGEWESELTGATWDQIRELAAAGWEIGSHTRSHPRLTTLSDADLTDELAGSREDCAAALGQPCASIAYPYGDVDARVAAAASECGYAAGASLRDRLEGHAAAPDPMRWPRAGVYRSDGALRVAAKATMLRRLPRAWALAQGGRRLLRGRGA